MTSSKSTLVAVTFGILLCFACVVAGTMLFDSLEAKYLLAATHETKLLGYTVWTSISDEDRAMASSDAAFNAFCIVAFGGLLATLGYVYARNIYSFVVTQFKKLVSKKQAVVVTTTTV